MQLQIEFLTSSAAIAMWITSVLALVLFIIGSVEMRLNPKSPEGYSGVRNESVLMEMGKGSRMSLR